MSIVKEAQGKLLGSLVDGALRGLSSVGKFHPGSATLRRDVIVEHNIAYGPEPSHRLDVYRRTDLSGPRPVMLYVHGGGFRILSKDTHWMFGYYLARLGFVVFNIDYRLAPTHPYPAAIEDCSKALLWVMDHAADYQGDASQLAYAGESAGANLVSSLAIAGAFERPEPFAQEVFARDPSPLAVLPACGILQVSEPERYLRRSDIPKWMLGRLAVVCSGYFPRVVRDPLTLADPLCILESDEEPVRPLPPMMSICGLSDPILEDTERLEHALRKRSDIHKVSYYPGGHAFHALFWAQNAKTCWADQRAFLKTHVPTLHTDA